MYCLLWLLPITDYFSLLNEIHLTKLTIIYFEKNSGHKIETL